MYFFNFVKYNLTELQNKNELKGVPVVVQQKGIQLGTRGSMFDPWTYSVG